ncbi:MAG: type II secretion system protein GspD [Fimbriimonadaceae bacterium]|nr:type II secretion system protein GspD [Fimbriimonadaceae bacterium]
MMQRTLRTGIALLAALSALTAAPLAIAQVDPAEKRVDLTLRGADILSALQALSSITKVEYVLAGDVDSFHKIDIALTDRPASVALEAVCQAAGGYAVRREDGIYVIRFGAAPKEGAKPVETPIGNLILTKKIKVMHGDPEDILRGIVQGQMTGVDSTRNIGDLTPRAGGVGMPKNISFANYSGGNLTPQTSYPQDTVNKQVNEAANGILLPNENPFAGMGNGENPAQRGGGGGALGGGGGGGQFGGGGGQFGGGNQGGQGQQQGGGSVSQLTGGQFLVPEGIEDVIYDPTDNSFIVQGTEEAIREFERLLEQFDVAPKQVVIKVEFIATSENAEKALGIDWLYARGTIFAGTVPGNFARNGDPVFINYSTGNLETRLRTLLQNGWGRVIQAPLVRTLNNQPAVVQQLTTIPIFQPQILQGQNNFIITYTVTPFPIQTVLAVRPRINNDGTITVFLSPQLTDITGFATSPNGTVAPQTVAQSIQLVARVKDGETIALAGFTSKRDSYNVRRIPILSDLPIIGQLFRSRDETKASSELIIFVTPTVVNEDEFGLGGRP